MFFKSCVFSPKIIFSETLKTWGGGTLFFPLQFFNGPFEFTSFKMKIVLIRSLLHQDLALLPITSKSSSSKQRTKRSFSSQVWQRQQQRLLLWRLWPKSRRPPSKQPTGRRESTTGDPKNSPRSLSRPSHWKSSTRSRCRARSPWWSSRGHFRLRQVVRHLGQ